MNCEFCENPEIKRRTIVKNSLAFAFPTNIPIVPGHVLVCTIRHVKYFEDLTDDERGAVESLRLTLKQALKKVFGAEGFNYAWNEEPVGGQSVPHLHLHMLPRKQGDAGVHNYEPREFLYRSSSSRPVSPDAELDEVVREIQKVL